ncbi:MAG TPA: chemotaxis protein CheW [Acidimicrobiia bacterium]|nr:chemotaxis protein CheW [Acidimicrobiia bacterium]
MRTVVRFRTERGLFAIPVDQTRAVYPAEGIVALPEAREDVAGVVQRPEGPITVLSALGPGDRHVLVLDAAGRLFGLLVEEVTGLERLDEADIGPPPDGQESSLVVGTLSSGGEMVLLVDAAALARRLEP